MAAEPMRIGALPVLAALLLATTLSACGPGTASPSASPTPRPVVAIDELEAQPIERREETVEVAFDGEAASALLEDVPSDVDFGTHAVLCVFLGPRQTTGWSLDLRTASLTGRELRVRARETAPRTGTRPEVTYPADCGLLRRGALPAGELRVWAEDTVTDEFIAETVIEVPQPATSP